VADWLSSLRCEANTENLRPRSTPVKLLLPTLLELHQEAAHTTYPRGCIIICRSSGSIQAGSRYYSYLTPLLVDGCKTNEGFFRPFCTQEGNAKSAPPSTNHDHQVILSDFNYLLHLSVLDCSDQFLGCATTLQVIYNFSSHSLFYLFAAASSSALRPPSLVLQPPAPYRNSARSVKLSMNVGRQNSFKELVPERDACGVCARRMTAQS
jgi:hypothetical protein